MAYMNAQLNGLGIFDPMSLIAPVASSLLKGDSGGSGSKAPPQVAVQAQVSPQISPIFQQQFQPSNSPISAGASQYMPTAQGALGPSVPGSIPGASPFPEMPSAAGVPVSLPGSSSVLPATIFGMQAKHVIIGAAVIAAVILIARNKRKNRYSSRRVDLEV